MEAREWRAGGGLGQGARGRATKTRGAPAVRRPAISGQRPSCQPASQTTTAIYLPRYYVPALRTVPDAQADFNLAFPLISIFPPPLIFPFSLRPRETVLYCGQVCRCADVHRPSILLRPLPLLGLDGVRLLQDWTFCPVDPIPINSPQSVSRNPEPVVTVTATVTVTVIRFDKASQAPYSRFFAPSPWHQPGMAWRRERRQFCNPRPRWRG